jgi:hypothetical protein
MARTPIDTFIEGFPNGLVALVKQGNGRYRLIVSRPANKPDLMLAEAETKLGELLEYAVVPKQPAEDEDDD